MKIKPAYLIVFFTFDAVIIILLVFFFMNKPKTYEQGEEINDHGNLITVNKTEKIDPGSATMDGDYFKISLKYVVPDGPLKGPQPELFRLENGDGDLFPVEQVSHNWDDQVWTNSAGVKNYNGTLFLSRAESPGSDVIEYRVKLKVE